MTEKESKWIKFCPSLELPKERVSIAYDTHDDRGYRFAYGYFQFNNGTCGCFWKDGNEQPKVVKSEDIKYWMPVPSLDVQEEPVSEDLEKTATQYGIDNFPSLCNGCKHVPVDAFKAGAQWQKENLWKPADGDDLPEYEREVVVFTQNFPNDAGMMMVAIGHRPTPEGYDGKSLTIGEVEHYIPEIYGKGGWNIPDVVYWLDVNLPKEIEL